MKKKKTDFGARFWSGTRKHSAAGLLEAFFQFNDLAEVKETINTMVQCSVQKNTRILEDPAEVFHLYQSLRSLVRACCLIGKKAKKGKFKAASETNVPKIMTGPLSAEEYRDPVRAFRRAFSACSVEEYDEFLSLVVYFSLGDHRCDQEKKIVIPYIQLMKMLDAAWLITERASTGKVTGK
ncbi:hypothetical protein SD427_10595 [Chryseobacterium sp. JJR-5R]|uniref:hypothetical protein n=1 Tax=Chryseobacterium sp. JJR-5R TaxID=3093923 RepID=UPI002A7548B3|nr:hypothetical protein [Chryseobacterium sp. JJR-5R]WPO81209.1 hypothetical protein SD427_10595 [Chryseobacterium sp. JJR-5R]